MTVAFYHAHTDACDPVCILDQFAQDHPWAIEQGDDQPAVLLRDTPEDRERLAAEDHKWSVAHEKIHCAHHYLPVRPCTPEDHYAWADAILTALRGSDD